jgi:hypothetical protein
MEAATHIARKTSQLPNASVDFKLQWVYQHLLGTPATTEELKTLTQSFTKLLNSLPADQTDREIKSLSIVVHAILASSRFQYYE